MMASAGPDIIDEYIHEDGPGTATESAPFSLSQAKGLGLGADPGAAVGAWVRLATYTDESHEGLIFAWDPIFQVIVLQAIPSSVSEGSPIDPTTTPSDADRLGRTGSESPVVPKPNGRPLSFAAAAAAAAGKSRSSSASPAPTQKPASAVSTSRASSPAASVTSGTGDQFDFHIFKLNHVREIEVLGRAGEGGANAKTVTIKGTPRSLPTLVPVGQVSLEKAAAREQAAVSRVGLGVSSEAQLIFDHLAKTLPTNWRGNSIVIMGEIQILPPYTSDDCKVVGNKQGSETTLARVRKVLEGVRVKLGLHSGK
ncbi:protein with role in RNA processing [Gaertneriomyces sp. JEL0708]|nr:protein with role in RNA processing [Gaertneriomyces sp. JEL0708]